MSNMTLEIGKAYRATRLGFEDEVDFGQGAGLEQIFMPDRVEEFVVHPKPATVIAFDGYQKQTIALPDHLAQPDWYCVAYFKKPNKKYWFSTKGVDRIEEIPHPELK